jgi:hypothetical protein
MVLICLMSPDRSGRSATPLSGNVGVQSPVSCKSTIGIFDAQVSFEPLAESERYAGDMPEALVA